MLNTFNCFASHGNEWIVEKIRIKFAKLSPMRDGSYIYFTNDLHKQKLMCHSAR